MFGGAGKFKQDLCEWGDNINTSANTAAMFYYAGCDEDGDPSFDTATPGPFCVICPGPPTSSPTSSPTKSPNTKAPTLPPIMKETVKFSDYDELFTQVRSYVLLGKQGYDWADGKRCGKGEITCGETYGYVALLK
jgi:hypothetical protein